ncbi:hypothetical protein OG905_13710 [Streptomyces sp. NBC_00322]|uniref:hypothetical protein n=1 Tax=Streptomyces sp. NBC_00322 TaxID=2975712 RepID=UPI002E2D261E|nr:hypothetical protein [Streptomyces sp. NBC_00322]
MGGLLAELGKKLAERWLSLLVLPGCLYLATVVVADTLGHTHPFDSGRLVHRTNQWANSRPDSTAWLAIVLLAVLLASAAAGLAAQAAGALTASLWYAVDWAAWPSPLRQFASARVTSRQQRWQSASDSYDALLAAERSRRRVRRGTTNTPPVDLQGARLRVTRIAEERPARPTWVGDRIHGVAVRLRHRYGIDMATVWPPLWLALPDTGRVEITAARDSLTRATTLAGWGLLYLVAGALWWPGLLVAAAIAATAWRRTRAAADTYALLLEAAIRVYVIDLVRQLGLAHEGKLDKRTGYTLTWHLQSRDSLIRATSPHPPNPAT